ncbi:MAG: RNA polymerase sigma-70 factor [Bacteroidales bacterium]|jgi:RNA polymerase sigma-70 factor (ECF subfamily)|nr:RNA polymerase sigma-70 factor [Bacteroidales bacterium]
MNGKEQVIIDLLKNGDNRAYKYLYDHHYALLCRIAYEFLKDDFLAQSVADDLILHIYENREMLTITSPIRYYLIRAVKNRCINHLQLKHEKKEISFSVLKKNGMSCPDIPDPDEYPDANLIEKEMEDEVNKAVNKLPAECKAVFEKSRFEGKSYPEIASDLNISVNTVKYHMKNALAILRKYLSEHL